MAFRIEHLADCPQHLALVAAWQQTEFGYLNPSITLEQREARLRDSLQGAGPPLTMVAVWRARRMRKYDVEVPVNSCIPRQTRRKYL